jgi:hypothetical protein
MTAFLTFGFLRAQAAPARLREASPRVDASRLAGWLIAPIRHWRTGNKAPELPPG